ncbi:glycosyltransferase [Candidatus Woesearchaeota archaeon]|nr:glycosyltransferase [Candidatus Woesearchaeota archaeon]
MNILRDTTLCAIVRDEIINPAGGIRDFVESTVPFMEKAIIVDTGSIDGTRQYLEDAKKRYAHLDVLDHPFEGYGPSRNVSIRDVTTDWILVLDADERLMFSDFEELGKERELSPEAIAFSFDFLTVSLIDVKERLDISGNNPRFFSSRKNIFYDDLVFEVPSLRGDPVPREKSKVQIKHFTSGNRILKSKD